MHTNPDNEKKYEYNADPRLLCEENIESTESVDPQTAKEAKRKEKLKLIAGIIAISLLDMSLQYFLYSVTTAFIFQNIGLHFIVVMTRCGVDIAYILYLKKRVKPLPWVLVIYFIVGVVLRNVLTHLFKIQMTFTFV